MKFINLERIDAIKIQFKKPIFEDDFPEKGMKAWLTDIVKKDRTECYELYFDFTDFENENLKYFKAIYYDEVGEPTLTAIESDNYNQKYKVCFGDIEWDQYKLEVEINKHLQIID